MSVDIDSVQSRLSPSNIAKSIQHIRGTGISLYVHGAPGISKSAITRQVADGFGIAFIDFRLTSVAPEDIRGVPYMDDVGGMRGLLWTPPLVFPRDLDLAGTFKVDDIEAISFYNPVGNNGIHYCREPEITVKCFEKGKIAKIVDRTLNRFIVSVCNEDGSPATAMIAWTVKGKSDAILGLEEFNSATPNVMAAAYQLILDRRIGDYVVPDGVMLVAMGNRDGDKGVTFKIPKPVANRFSHLEMIVLFEDWQEWAMLNAIHSDILGYLSRWPSHLFDDKFADRPDHAFYTPRTWEFLSKIISKPGFDALPTAVKNALICGTIGNVMGNAFITHREYMEDMPDVHSIFDGTVRTFNPKNPQYKTQIAFSTCIQMCYELKKESDAISQKYRGDVLARNKSPEKQRWYQKMDRALGYAMDNFTPEILVVLNRLALKIYKLGYNSSIMSRFLQFAGEHRSDIM
jgi:hypothetical protein